LENRRGATLIRQRSVVTRVWGTVASSAKNLPEAANTSRVEIGLGFPGIVVDPNAYK
jgi:hypothetical protein